MLAAASSQPQLKNLPQKLSEEKTGKNHSKTVLKPHVIEHHEEEYEDYYHEDEEEEEGAGDDVEIE